jgi:hypothetical protein
MSLGHGVIKPFLGTDRLAIPVIELAVRSVDMDVPPRLEVLIALDGTCLLFPGKLLCLLRRDGLVKRFPMPAVFSHRVKLLGRLRSLLRLLLRNFGDLGRMSALVRHITAERLGELLPVTGEDLRIVRPARDSDISHAVVDEVPGSQFCVDVDEDAIRGLALAGMTGDGIAMIQVRMLSGVDAHASASVQPQAHSTIVGDALDSPELAVGDLQVIRRRSELDTVANRESLLLLPIDRNALLAAWVKRLIELVLLQKQAQGVAKLVGQALERAVLRVLQGQTALTYYGDFLNLEAHDDSKLYKKEEPPPSVSGRRIPGEKKLDFLVHDADGNYAGIEVKNVRQWFYPDREEIRELLLKCCALDAVPVLIARRLHFSTFSVLNPCGVILHQTFNQLYPNTSAELVAKLRDKRQMGFHDILLIDGPDAAGTHGRLQTFVGNLADVLPEARAKFEEYKDLLCGYAHGEYKYSEFAARVKRRGRGEPEDLPQTEPGDFECRRIGCRPVPALSFFFSGGPSHPSRPGCFDFSFFPTREPTAFF